MKSKYYLRYQNARCMIRLGYMQVHKLGCVICVGVVLGVGLELRL